MNVYDKAPVVHKEAFVAPNASLMGEVRVGQGSSIWYGCVLRGNYIKLNCSLVLWCLLSNLFSFCFVFYCCIFFL